jgi:hypothetical protein
VIESRCLIALFSVLVSLHSAAETVPDRKGAVLQDRASLENDPRWIYDDFERGFAEARDTGKPLLVVLRCIPCLACGGLDARVLLENTELSPLLDQFVCVRLINANALDLNRFQFDFDLSLSALIFNGDGTVYGRYGSWAHQTDPQESATDGFRLALEAALEIHREIPARKASLAGKQPRPSPFQTPIDIPALRGRYTRNLDWEGAVVQSCVHCHQIGEALRSVQRQRREPLPLDLIYPFPPPETIGLELALNHMARIKAVTAGSVAARAELREGDDILVLDGQPLLSIADVSWVLHRAPDSGSLKALVQRGQDRLELAITLPDGWRQRADISRRVGTWSMRAMALGGLQLVDLSDEERQCRSLSPNQMALRAKHVGQYGEHAAAMKAGFQKDDVLVATADWSDRQTESELIGQLLRKYQPGESIQTTVLRGDKSIQLTLPIQ